MLLLPHQYELLADTTTKIIGLCSGFGGGKTYSAARKAVHLALLNPGVDGIITEPTFPLLVQVMFPELMAALDFFGVKYKFNKVESIFYCDINGQTTRIICGSMENYQRLIGINAAWCVCDEFDTAKQETAYAAYMKLLGRLRRGNVRQLVIVSTPEGFKAMYQIFVTEADSSKRLIRAKTTDNYHLPADYVESMRSQYPEQLINAYLNGEFVNLTS
ncbi:terminase, partial [Salmonella enterica subsp. enterica serovar Dublin]|nr:terminase [Salmonella enterica subsp. enterica serovar Dublin]